MYRVVGRVHVILCITLLLAAASLAISLPVKIQAQTADSTLVYHQITAFPEETGGVGYPVLSADGSNAVFSNAPGTGDPTTPNRILVIVADGGSMVDISADGSTIVSTEGVQLRIADANGARELVVLGGEITALVISGDGETIFFIVRRDTATVDGATPIARGIWAIDADGRDLRLVAGAEDVANALGVASETTVEATVDTTGTVLGVGFAALLDGSVVDAKVGQGSLLLDDGKGADSIANDNVYTLGGIVHTNRVTREDDAGPRTVRIAVEITGSDGRRHAAAVDIGILTVSP